MTPELRTALLAVVKAQRSLADAVEQLVKASGADGGDGAPAYLSARQVEERGLMSRGQVLAAVKSGALPGYRHGREVRVRAVDLEQYLAGQKHTPKARPERDTMDPFERALASGRLSLVKGGS